MPEKLPIPTMVAAADPDILDDAIDEALLEEEDTGEESLHYEITSYGADYDVDGLVKRLKKGDIKIPDFQRGYVWPIKQASRFIESLLLGLPVPGIFLSKEDETNKLLVIDGQQRLRTVGAFYDGIFPTSKREFSLMDVQEGFEGKTYKTLEDEHPPCLGKFNHSRDGGKADQPRGRWQRYIQNLRASQFERDVAFSAGDPNSYIWRNPVNTALRPQ